MFGHLDCCRCIFRIKKGMAMTRDDVIRMAREAGMRPNYGCVIDGEHKPAINALKSDVPIE